MALPNIFHGTQVLAPGEGQNKSAHWLCEGRTQFYWLRYAQQLSEARDSKAPRALAIATNLQALDAKPAPTLHEDDPEETAHWFATIRALNDAMEAGKEFPPWDTRFVLGILENPPATYSPKRRKEIARMALQHLGERI